MSQGLQLSLAQLHAWLPRSTLVGDPNQLVTRVHTDSRTLMPGDLFIALKGERFDGHDYLSQLVQQGVHTAIATHGLAQAGVMGLEVADTRKALAQLSHAWRSQFVLPLVAVTGSNGKTTVTQMIANILKAWQGDKALATLGNFNNDIGVPLTLLRLRQQHQCAVLELGMNHPGEIAELAALVQPTVALVNNAQREHQEFMQSVQAVAEENGQVIEGLPSHGVAVFPAGDAHTHVWQAMANGRSVLTFGMSSTADIHVVSSRWADQRWQLSVQTPKGLLQTGLAVAGQHNVLNALASIACAIALEVPVLHIAQGLASFQPVAGRSRSLLLQYAGRDLWLIDDTYNANPDSVRAAIDVLAQSPQPRLLVLGDMGEVGTQGPQFHAEVGRYAKASGIEHLVTLGELTRDTAKAFASAKHCQSIDEAYAQVQMKLPSVATVLVKGSRFMQMERVVQSIQAWAEKVPSNAKEVSCS